MPFTSQFNSDNLAKDKAAGRGIYSDSWLKQLRNFIFSSSLPSPTAEIEQHIEQQIRQHGADYHYEAKIAIVGEPGAGKTSLAKKIQNAQYSLSHDEPSTNIDIIDWEFTNEDDRQVKVNIWDFGGQTIYRSLHRLFFTQNTLYILVADNRKEDTIFSYWLDQIVHSQSSCPIIIILNEKQGRKKKIDETYFINSYPSVKAVISTDLATNQGLEEVVSQIKLQIIKLPHLKRPLPTTWVKVKSELDKLTAPFISFQKFAEVCNVAGQLQDEKILVLAKYLNDSGVVLYLESSDLLKRTMVLNPSWLTKAIYQVIEDKEVTKHNGLFIQKDRARIWQAKHYKDMHLELVQYMVDFGYMYEIPNKPKTYRIPELLPLNPPQFNWNRTNNLVLKYQYTGFLPEEILLQFIVTLHNLIPKEDLVWRHGVILEFDETSALVVLNKSSNALDMHIKGKNRRQLLTILIFALNQINKRFEHLFVDIKISCNCSECIDSDDPTYYSLDWLKERLHRGKLQFDCQKPPFNSVNVYSLLGDLTEKEQNASPQNLNKIIDELRSPLIEEIKQDIYSIFFSGIELSNSSKLDSIVRDSREFDETRKKLYKGLTEGFNLEELQILAFEMGIQYEDFSSKKAGFVRELIEYCERHNRVEELKRICQIKRPSSNW